jgi:hypothetical protein
MSGLLASFAAAGAAFWFAQALGIPIWRNWPPGDCTDIAILTGFVVAVLASRKPT